MIIVLKVAVTVKPCHSMLLSVLCCASTPLFLRASLLFLEVVIVMFMLIILVVIVATVITV